ncbi:MAG TPA: NADH-quinone oxidoreductase subunit NuoH [Gemmataceae bacterium]|nr:NADH-quinone oxidoreductase subunit NuoH [Gemmataceae bacterium]
MYTWRDFWITVITIAVVMGALQLTCAYLILLERKIAAWVQDRIGPNRAGPRGLFQPIADGLKFLFKEDIIPSHVDKVFYLLAPAVAAGTATLAFAVVPFGPTSADPGEYQFVIAPRLDIGILFTFSITSLAVYGIILGGWSSNDKYSMLGALRSSAQLISYEIPLGLSVLGVILFTGSLNLERAIQQQIEGGWNILYQPLAFLIFLVGVLAECNRLPFDLPEAEQELVGGYHTEYGALKFGLFFLGEYTHMITTSFLLATLFFGGWHVPWLQGWIDGLGFGAVIIKLGVFVLKASFFIVFYMLLRWTLPRFRFDQLMGLAWKVLIPLALVNLVCVMIVEEAIRANGLSHAWRWSLLPISLVIVGASAMAAAKLPRRPAQVSLAVPARFETVPRG